MKCSKIAKSAAKSCDLFIERETYCNNGCIFCHLHCSAICMSINISIFLVADIMICNYLIINAPSAYRSHCRKLFLILIDTNSNVINQF